MEDAAEQKVERNVVLLTQLIEGKQTFVVDEPGMRIKSGLHVDARAGAVDDKRAHGFHGLIEAVFHGTKSGKAGEASGQGLKQFDQVFVVQVWQHSQGHDAVHDAAVLVFLQEFVHGLPEQGGG